jgi:hypothetical protein
MQRFVPLTNQTDQPLRDDTEGPAQQVLTSAELVLLDALLASVIKVALLAADGGVLQIN